MKSLFCFVLSSLLIAMARFEPLNLTHFNQETFLDPEKNFKMLWNFNSTHIVIKMRVQTTGWIGIGFSELGSMAKADIHVGWISGNRVTIQDRHGSNGNSFPPLDPEQNLKLIEGMECNGQTEITFIRQLAACEIGFDRAINEQTTRVIYAFGSADPTGEYQYGDYHGFENRGAKSLLLLQPQASGSTPINDDNVRSFDIVADGKPIPRKSTYYKCMLVKIPKFNETKHVIKTEPLINQTYIKNVHHIIISSCLGGYDKILDPLYGGSWDCYNQRRGNNFVQQICQKSLGGWAVGGEGKVYPPNVGLPIGEDGSVYARIEMHYDNPYQQEILDNSGMRFYYTPRTREFDAGTFVVGLPTTGTHLVVPPGIPEFKTYGGCDSACLGGAMKIANISSINVFNVLPHSHLAGRKIELRHIRNGVELPPILKDDSYDFDYQQSHSIAPERVIQKGDELLTICSYSSMGRSRPIVGGLNTNQEMCLNFVSYYPRIPLGNCLGAPRQPVNNYLKKLLKVSEVSEARRQGFQLVTLRKTFDDIIVKAPEENANYSIGDLMSKFEWNETTSKGLEESWRKGFKLSFCHRQQIPALRFRAPLKISTPFQEPPPQQCTAPSSGFMAEVAAGLCQV